MKTSIILSLFAALLITFPGCNFLNPSQGDDNFMAQDGNAGTLSYEFNDMGNALTEMPGLGLNAPQTRSSTDDTIIIDIVIKPWHFDATCKGWIREAQVTYEAGSASKYDTVWFYDAGGTELQFPTISTIANYKHVRATSGTLYQNTFNYRYDINVNLEKTASDTVFVFNGTITGDYNGTTFATTEILNVKRKIILGLVTWLSYPYDGTISMDLPLRTIFIEFGGDNTASVTVTRKSDGKTWIFIVNINTGKESS